MRSGFERELEHLHTRLIEMGAMCESAISSSAEALTRGDFALADQVFSMERELDRAEREIEDLCLKLLLRQQPVARDLRMVSAVLKMVTDMERIGDQAADIAEIVKMDNIRVSDSTDSLVEMAGTTMEMVTKSIDAHVRQDLDLARRVIDMDDIVDGLFDRVKGELLAFIAAGGDGEHAIDLIMIAKYFERIGDHATNIAEWVVFSITGLHPEA